MPSMSSSCSIDQHNSLLLTGGSKKKLPVAPWLGALGVPSTGLFADIMPAGLNNFCCCCCRGPHALQRFVTLGLAVMSVCAASFGPFIMAGQLSQVSALLCVKHSSHCLQRPHICTVCKNLQPIAGGHIAHMGLSLAMLSIVLKVETWSDLGISLGLIPCASLAPHLPPPRIGCAHVSCSTVLLC